MTMSHLIRDSAVMISSTMPSAKYSCSGSPLMFWNGITASDGLSGSGGMLLDGIAMLARARAKRGDLHVEIAVFARHTRPDRGDDLGPYEEVPWPLHQHAENVES